MFTLLLCACTVFTARVTIGRICCINRQINISIAKIGDIATNLHPWNSWNIGKITRMRRQDILGFPTPHEGLETRLPLLSHVKASQKNISEILIYRVTTRGVRLKIITCARVIYSLRKYKFCNCVILIELASQLAMEN